MQACSSGLANRLKDSLHQLELVGRKGIILHEVITITILPERHPAVGEGELMVDNVAFLTEKALKVSNGFRSFRQQPLLNHFIHIGAGE